MHSVLGWHWSDESVSQSTKTSPAAAASQAKRYKRRQEIHCKETESHKRERARERETGTHTQQDAVMSEGKGSDLDLVPDPLPLALPLPVPLSQGVTNLCHIFLCSPRICYTCYTVHTPYAPESPSVYHLPSSGFCCVSAGIVWRVNVSVRLPFFLSFFPFFGNHFCGRSTSSIECRGRQRLIHQPRLALLIVDSLQKCATSCSHRRPLWCLQIAHCVGSLDHILDTYRDRTQPGTKMCRSSAQRAPCTCKNFNLNTLCVGCRRGDLPEN